MLLKLVVVVVVVVVEVGYKYTEDKGGGKPKKYNYLQYNYNIMWVRLDKSRECSHIYVHLKLPQSTIYLNNNYSINR